jgi:hypothetical protein
MRTPPHDSLGPRGSKVRRSPFRPGQRLRSAKPPEQRRRVREDYAGRDIGQVILNDSQFGSLFGRATPDGRLARDKPFVPRASREKHGLAIHGDNLIIPAKETKLLLSHWLHWLPRFLEQEGSTSTNHDDVLEKAFILATIRACHAAYGAVPGEREMQRATSLLSRKINAFYLFSREWYFLAKRNGIDLESLPLSMGP